jgi:hypothetical protein
VAAHNLKAPRERAGGIVIRPMPFMPIAHCCFLSQESVLGPRLSARALALALGGYGKKALAQRLRAVPRMNAPSRLASIQMRDRTPAHGTWHKGLTYFGLVRTEADERTAASLEARSIDKKRQTTSVGVLVCLVVIVFGGVVLPDGTTTTVVELAAAVLGVGLWRRSVLLRRQAVRVAGVPKAPRP